MDSSSPAGPRKMKSGAQARAARGPMVVHPRNPRYFADPDGRVVYLTGSHTWASLQDKGMAPLPVFDFEGYLAMLEEWGHNFIRLWTWENAAWSASTLEKKESAPLVYVRSGPGLALDGKPKFDVTRFDPEYFTRLRSRVEAAGRRGVLRGRDALSGLEHHEKGLGRQAAGQARQPVAGPPLPPRQ